MEKTEPNPLTHSEFKGPMSPIIKFFVVLLSLLSRSRISIKNSSRSTICAWTAGSRASPGEYGRIAGGLRPYTTLNGEVCSDDWKEEL
jgi:hypothetical protein